MVLFWWHPIKAWSWGERRLVKNCLFTRGSGVWVIMSDWEVAWLVAVTTSSSSCITWWSTRTILKLFPLLLLLKSKLGATTDCDVHGGWQNIVIYTTIVAIIRSYLTFAFIKLFNIIIHNWADAHWLDSIANGRRHNVEGFLFLATTFLVSTDMDFTNIFFSLLVCFVKVTTTPTSQVSIYQSVTSPSLASTASTPLFSVRSLVKQYCQHHCCLSHHRVRKRLSYRVRAPPIQCSNRHIGLWGCWIWMDISLVEPVQSYAQCFMTV